MRFHAHGVGGMSPHLANLRLSVGDVATGRGHRACVTIYVVERARNPELAEVQGPYSWLAPPTHTFTLCDFTPMQIKWDQLMGRREVVSREIPIEAWHVVSVQ